MAKHKTSINFSKAVIDFKAMTITEITKDDERTYDLTHILRSWDGIDNVSFSISSEDEIPIKE